MDPVSDIPGLARLWQDIGGGDPAIRRAITDGPADFAHPSPSGAGLSFGGSTAGAIAAVVGSERGTHDASVLIGQPGGPILGIAPNATARKFAIYRDGDDGEPMPSSQADLAPAIDHAVAEGAHPNNISNGPLAPTGQAERFLARTVSCNAPLPPISRPRQALLPRARRPSATAKKRAAAGRARPGPSAFDRSTPVAVPVNPV